MYFHYPRTAYIWRVYSHPTSPDHDHDLRLPELVNIKELCAGFRFASLNMLSRIMFPRVLYRNPSTAAYRLRFSHGLRPAVTPRYYSVVANAPPPNKKKVWDSVDEAIRDVKSGDTVLSGGTLYTIHYIADL